MGTTQLLRLSLHLILVGAASLAYADPDDRAEMDATDMEQWLQGEDLQELEIPDLDDFLTPLPLWDFETILKGGGGYRDNARSSAADPEGGGFVLAGLETMWLRLPPDGPRFTFFLEAEHLEFVTGDDLPADTFVSSFSQLRFDTGTGIEAILGLGAFFLDEIVDVTTSEIVLEPIRVRGYGFTPSASVRKTWPSELFIEAKASASRQWFHDPLHDFWEYGPKLSTGWTPGNSEISFSVEYLERDYDDRRAIATDGTSIPDSEVDFHILRPGLTISHTWGEERQWRSYTELGMEFNRDSETDYFSYDRIRTSQRFTFSRDPWDLTAHLRYSFYDYKVQRTDDGESNRIRHSWGAGVEIQRNLSDRCALFGRYDRDWVRSNEPETDYSVDTWSAGLTWQF